MIPAQLSKTLLPGAGFSSTTQHSEKQNIEHLSPGSCKFLCWKLGRVGVQREGVFLGNPKDSVWEDWGTEQGTLGHAILTQALFFDGSAQTERCFTSFFSVKASASSYLNLIDSDLLLWLMINSSFSQAP